MPTTRTRQVFDTAEVPHLWAHQTQQTGRNKQGNLFFEGDTIYSYGYHFPIARIIKRKGNRPQSAFMTTDEYSSMTGKHKGIVRAAMRGNFEVFDVPNPLAEPADVLKYFRNAVARAIAKYETNKTKGEPSRFKAFRDYIAIRADAIRFVECFGYRTAFNLPADFAETMAALAAYEDRLDERRTAKQERKRLKWEQENAERIAKATAEIAEWRDFKIDHLTYSGYCAIALRIRGDAVETSRGAKFPLSDAVRVLPRIESLLSRPEPIESNIRLGHYSIQSIEADGTVIAGCHRVSKDEVLRVIADIRSRGLVAG